MGLVVVLEEPRARQSLPEPHRLDNGRLIREGAVLVLNRGTYLRTDAGFKPYSIVNSSFLCLNAWTLGPAHRPKSR